MVECVVLCESLVKDFGSKRAVDGLNLKISRGECLGLLGPNGAGKTTTVEMLEGLISPTSGRLELFGTQWGAGQDTTLRKRIGVQLQETVLADKLKIEEVLLLFRSFCDRGSTVDELLDLVELRPEREKLYHTLSGGQKQRVALACALAGNPDLLFLDEPTTGLDPRARQSLWRIVQRFQDGGGTVLITTHYMEEAAALCERIVIMDQGQLIAEGSPAQLIDSLGLVQFVEFEADDRPDVSALTAVPTVSSVEENKNRYRLKIDRSLSALSAVLLELERQSIAPRGLSTHQATLDDVFLQLTGRGLSSDNSEAQEGNS